MNARRIARPYQKSVATVSKLGSTYYLIEECRCWPCIFEDNCYNIKIFSIKPFWSLFHALELEEKNGYYKETI